MKTKSINTTFFSLMMLVCITSFGFAKEKGFAIVFDLSGSSVAYFNKEFDITEEVIKRYNASKPEKK